MDPITLVVVDPDEAVRERTIEGLRGELPDLDLSVVPCGSLADAEAALEDTAVDCVISEYDLPDGTGVELFDRVRETAPDAGCILFTSADRDAIDTAPFGGMITEYVGKGTADAVPRLARLVRQATTFKTQASYPLPRDEADRLAALDEYRLDAGAVEASIDRVTELAARHFDVPVSSVNVITEHTQEFLVCHGADWSRTSREDSICTFTMLADDGVMVVEDTRADPRFEDTRQLREFGIRAYMGATIAIAGGHVIGTLCVYDEEPRSFGDDERDYLRLLAEVAADLIELHSRAAPADAAGATEGGE